MFVVSAKMPNFDRAFLPSKHRLTSFMSVPLIFRVPTDLTDTLVSDKVIRAEVSAVQ